MLERHELEAFLTLAEELHFGRTAERLHVSTARISQTIAKLERRVGVRLFDRTSRRVQLTPVGAELAASVRPAWTTITEAVTRAVAAGRGLTGTLTVAFTGPAAGQLVMGVVQTFRERHPECEVRIREAQFADVVPWLWEGEADLALTRHSVDVQGVVTGPVLVTEAQMLAVPAGHPFTRRPSIPVAELSRVPVLEIDSSAATLNELLTLVGAGSGTALVGAHTRRYFQRPDVAYVAVERAEPVRWGLVWRTGAESARVRAFAEAAEQTVS